MRAWLPYCISSLPHEFLYPLHIVQETAIWTFAIQIMDIMPKAVVAYLSNTHVYKVKRSVGWADQDFRSQKSSKICLHTTKHILDLRKISPWIDPPYWTGIWKAADLSRSNLVNLPCTCSCRERIPSHALKVLSCISCSFIKSSPQLPYFLRISDCCCPSHPDLALLHPHFSYWTASIFGSIESSG